MTTRTQTWYRRLLGLIQENLSLQADCQGTGLPPFAHLDRIGSLLSIRNEIAPGIFTLAEPSDDTPAALGYVLEIRPQTGVTSETARHLESVFSADLPQGSAVSVTLFASPHIQTALTDYTDSRPVQELAEPSLREQARLLRELTERRARYLKSGRLKTLEHADDFRIRHYRAWLSVSVPLRTGNTRSITAAVKSLLEQLLILRERHIAALKTDAFFRFVWDRKTLENTLSALLNGGYGFDEENCNAEPDPLRPINESVIRADTHWHVTADAVQMTSPLVHEKDSRDISAVGLSVHNWPERYCLAQTAEWIGTLSEDIPCPFLWSSFFWMPEFTATKNRAKLMAARAKQIADSEVAHYLPSLKRRSLDYEWVMQEYEHNGALVRAQHQLVLLVPQGQRSAAVNQAVAVMKSARLEPVLDTRMHLQSLLSSLPLSLTPAMQDDLMQALRFRTMTLSAMTHTVPLIAEWQGCGPRDDDPFATPLTLVTGRHGQITPIDLFSCPGNFNAIVVGTSGSGKSALTNDIITGNLATGGISFVIDVGESYKKLSELLGGQFMQFDAESEIVLNPFDWVHDPREDLGFLLPILTQMASPNEPLSDFLISVLQAHVLMLLSAPRYPGSVTVTDLVNSLKSGLADPSIPAQGKTDQRILDLAVQLEPFARDGAFGAYFDGAGNVDFHSNFVILELEGLKSRKALQSVVLLCLIFRITRTLIDSDKTQRKLVVIDEAWDLLSHKHAAAFIENGYRRARKQNASFMTVTQSFADYYQNETARAALENADIRFVLRQKSESVAFLEKEKKIVFSPWELRQIRSLRLKPDEYAEALVMMTDQPSSVVQIRFDPFSRLLFSSKAGDVAAVRRLQKSGLTLTQALDQLSRRTSEAV